MFKFIKPVFTAVAMLASFAACTDSKGIEKPFGGNLEIKYFFPTKVVPGHPMTISGSGLSRVIEVVFPGGVIVTDFETVGDGMIRISAPAELADEGGLLAVRTAEDEAGSRIPLTRGHTSVTGYSREEGEQISVGERLTIYGVDMEFVSAIEFIDSDDSQLFLREEEFWSKGAGFVTFTIPQYVKLGLCGATIHISGGGSIPMREFEYKEDSGGQW